MRHASLGAFAGLVALVVAPSTWAASAAQERQLTPGEIESWLEAEPGTRPADQGGTEGEEAPLPAPRRHGLVVESGLGAVVQMGSLKHVTPAAPWFQVRLGYELLRVVMPFVEADVAFARTTYAPEPPPPRSYFHYGVGAGVRATLPLGRLFGLFAQGSLGFARVSEQNVLSIYGFPDADEPNLYLDAQLGLEWYQVNPHLALAAHGGVRSYGAGLTRDRGGDPPLAALACASLRYAF